MRSRACPDSWISPRSRNLRSWCWQYREHRRQPMTPPLQLELMLAPMRWINKSDGAGDSSERANFSPCPELWHAKLRQPQSMWQERRGGEKESALRSAMTRVDPGLYVIGTPTHRGARACVQAYGAREIRVQFIAALLELRVDL